ncbi:MAG: hypothetical protein WBQ23_15975 [Bacteroidota bacterium]
MQHTELLHRFFDEGIDEPLEDVLFGQMALDPELRREFVSHLKLHSIIQEDVAGITTPSHVSQQLFTTLGLTPPAIAPVPTAGQRFGRSAGSALLLLRTAVIGHRRYLYTAAISALATMAVLFSLFGPGEYNQPANDKASSKTTSPAATPDNPSQEPDVSQISDVLKSSGVSKSSDASHIPSASQATGRTQAAAASQKVASQNPGASQKVGTIAAGLQKATLGQSTEILADPGISTANSGRGAVNHSAAEELSTLPVPLALAEMPASIQPEDRAAELRLEGTEIQVGEVPGIDPPWLFSQPGPRTSFLSNLVVELRKYYGTSYPNVDLQHNSHKVFENMAISVIHKANEHHAFGFEYGRESFGREFQRTNAAQSTSLVVDQSFEQIYTPPAQWVTGLQQENRMLDLFGAVWKLSLPEYGLFDVVYPYMRTFVGATKLGPLGKVRAGLEMYPSNFSMLNVGIEGGMLRYTVDDMSYYTTKLNFTFGVAIGF